MKKIFIITALSASTFLTPVINANAKETVTFLSTVYSEPSETAPPPSSSDMVVSTKTMPKKSLEPAEAVVFKAIPPTPTMATPSSTAASPMVVNGSPLVSVLRQTYQNNPTLRAVRADLAATQEELPQALSGWHPSASVDGNIQNADIEGSNFPGAGGTTSKDIALNLNQPLYRGGRTTAQTAAAKSVIAARIANVHAAEQSVLFDTIAAYADIERDKALLSLAEGNANVLEENYRAAKIRFEYGDLTKTDVAQADARVARAKSDIIEAETQIRITKSRFTELTGLDFDQTQLNPTELQHSVPPTLDAAIDIALNNSPVITQAESIYKASDKDIDSIYGELLPEVGAFANWNRTYDPQPGLIDEQTTRIVGVSASIPLYQAGATRSRIRQAKHVNNQRFLQTIEIKRAVTQDVTTNWETLMRARSDKRARQSQVSAATLAAEGVAKESELGARTVLDVLDAQQEVLDAQTALVTAMRDETVAKYGLLESMGVLTPRTLGFGDAQIDYTAYSDKIDGTLFKTHVDRLGFQSE